MNPGLDSTVGTFRTFNTKLTSGVKCLHYPRLGFKYRYQCTNQCFQRIFKNITNSIYNWIPIEGYSTMKGNLTYIGSPMSHASHECFTKLCPLPDCISTKYHSDFATIRRTIEQRIKIK